MGFGSASLPLEHHPQAAQMAQAAVFRVQGLELGCQVAAEPGYQTLAMALECRAVAYLGREYQTSHSIHY